MQVGRKIYYDKQTGNIIIDTGEMQGMVIPTTIEDDLLTYKNLSERNLESFDVIELAYGEYSQDFSTCNGYRINPETMGIEFSYPDEQNPEQQIYEEPLSIRVANIETVLNIILT